MIPFDFPSKLSWVFHHKMMFSYCVSSPSHFKNLLLQWELVLALRSASECLLCCSPLWEMRQVVTGIANLLCGRTPTQLCPRQLCKTQILWSLQPKIKKNTLNVGFILILCFYYRISCCSIYHWGALESLNSIFFHKKTPKNLVKQVRFNGN